MIQTSHFQKLYIRASCICRCPNLLVVRYLPEGPAAGIGIGYVPIGEVKDIENLQPELHALRFRDRNVFADRGIPSLSARYLIAELCPARARGICSRRGAAS